MSRILATEGSREIKYKPLPKEMSFREGRYVQWEGFIMPESVIGEMYNMGVLD
jgi:hypothetical protein